MKAPELSQHFIHCGDTTIKGFLRAANSAVPGLTLPNFKPIQDFMVVLMNTSQSKMKVIECSQHLTFIFQTLKVVGDGTWQKFKLIQAFMVTLVT